MTNQIVHLFVFNTLADWEIGYATSWIRKPDFQIEPGKYEIKTVGLTKEPVQTIGGLTILPDITLNELDPLQSSLLILPGGDDWETGKYSAATSKAQAFLAANVPVAAICGATSGLGIAGMLNEVKHTSNDLDYLKMVAGDNYTGEALYQPQLAVTAGNLITANSMGALDFAYHIIKLLGNYNEQVLEAWYNLNKTGDPQYFYALQEAAGGY